MMPLTLHLNWQSAVAAPIVANFSGGNGTGTPDAWTGMAGGGWADAWKTSINGNATLSATVATATPFPSAGNYLQVSRVMISELSTVSLGLMSLGLVPMLRARRVADGGSH